MDSNRDIIMSPISRRPKTTRKLSIDPQKDYSTPLLVETSVEYDLPPHIYPPKGATPILMLHPAYDVFKISNSPISTQSFSERKYDPLPHIANDVRKRPDTKVISGKHKCECEMICNSSLRKISRTAKLINNVRSKMPLGDSYSNSLANEVPSILYNTPPKTTIYNSIENQLILPEVAERKMRAQQQQSQVDILNSFCNDIVWSPPVSQNEPFPSMMTQKCQFGCCNAIVPSRSEFLAPGIPPSLIRTPGRNTSAGSPKVRARSRRAINSVNSVPDYLSATRPLRSLTTGLNIPPSHNHQRSRSNIALYSSTQSQQLSSSLTPQPIINQMPMSLSQTIPSSTVGPCRDSGCSIGTDSSCSTFNPNKHFTKKLDRISVGVDSGFNTPGDSPFDVHMEANDVNNNSSAFYNARNPQLVSKYSSVMNPTYAHLINLQNSLAPSVVPSYPGFSNSLIQPYYIHEPLLNLAY